MAKSLKILMVVAECTPFAKTGGLADVAGALPKFLKALGHDIRVVMPYYSRKIDSALYGLKQIPGYLDVPMGSGEATYQLSANILETVLPGTQVPVYMVANPAFFDREELYRTENGDYDDNAQRFTFFSRTIPGVCKHVNFKPDVIHCNDWHTGLLPAYLKTVYAGDEFFKATGCVFTIHNLGYQGLFPKDVLYMTGLPGSTFHAEGLEFYGQINFMKAGLSYADLITTVSARYSKEIQTNEYGFGLEGVLQRRAADFYGITNGIDTDAWSPEKDKFIHQNYSKDTLEKKAENKNVFLKEQGLQPEEGYALLGMISRLDNQKGFDLVAEVMDYIMNLKIQFVLLGNGEKKYHELFQRIKQHYPGMAAVNLTFDNELAHKIQAASDIFLMPSRFEPCGLNQLIAMRYGTVPVVRYTGGLADTVADFDPKTGEGTGFVFHDYSSMSFFNTVKRAVETYENKDLWKKLMLSGMNADFSWGASAREYEALYEKVVAKKTGA